MTGGQGARKVDPAVLREAHRLAGGDLRRLRFNDDGSVVVAGPRPGTGPTPTSPPSRREPVGGGDAVARVHVADADASPYAPELAPAYRFTGHALERCREFGIAPGVVGHILEHATLSRPSGGRRIVTSDAVPEWAAVTDTDPRGIVVVVSVVRRSYDRWEHS